MKTKINLTLLTLGFFLIIWFTNSKLTEEHLEPKPLVAMNFVKCTAPKYLLTADTTKQISPLFNNLGNLNFNISTTNERAQAFFDQGLKLSYAFNYGIRNSRF